MYPEQHCLIKRQLFRNQPLHQMKRVQVILGFEMIFKRFSRNCKPMTNHNVRLRESERIALNRVGFINVLRFLRLKYGCQTAHLFRRKRTAPIQRCLQSVNFTQERSRAHHMIFSQEPFIF